MQFPTPVNFPTPIPGNERWPWAREPFSHITVEADDYVWPKISVVTLSYNQAEFLEEAIRSVLLQGYPNLEYIVIDAGSTDGSVEVVKRYEHELAYWSSERDGGPAAGLNKGFQQATGEILGFLNADDFYLPGSLFEVAKLFRKHTSVEVICGDGYMTEESGKLREPIFSDNWNLWRMAYGTCVLVQPATFFRTTAFQKTNGFNERNSTCWDAELWADLALSGAAFHNTNKFFGIHRLHNGSITGSGLVKKHSSRDMTAMFERIMGRRKRVSDYPLALILRLLKFSGHPHRTLRYRLFQHSIRKSLFPTQF